MLRLTLSNKRQSERIEHPSGLIEVGRGPQRTLPRLVVLDAFASRDQLQLEELSASRVRIINLGTSVKLAGGITLATNQATEVALPVTVTFGYSTLEVLPGEDPYAESSALQTLGRPTLRPAADSSPGGWRLGDSPSTDVLMRWFEKLLRVQRAAAGSGEFYSETARAVVELIGLDRGAVLLRRAAEWENVANHVAHPELERPVSQRVLAHVAAERRTFYESSADQPLTQSLAGVEAVVASPILDEQDRVVGVLYGTRNVRPGVGATGVTPLEAQVVQLLAGAVSVGLARLDREAEVARSRVQFEQFFSPELARALERDPSLLEGQSREVTVMFADLRGFSGIAERVGPRQSYALLGEMLDRLTNRILEHGGVVIDYFGDGLAAMWNAPADQADHAQRACCAACAMLLELPLLNQSWAGVLGHALTLGIGINTGTALVGNSGSRRRVKYGPRGHVVNLASRVEGATKLLGVPCLITEFTEQAIPSAVHRRRLCRAQVTGMHQPVYLYELAGEDVDDIWLERRHQYEAALAAFEEDRLVEARQLLRRLLDGLGCGDAATRLLAEKTEARLALGTDPSDTDPRDSVFRLDTKA